MICKLNYSIPRSTPKTKGQFLKNNPFSTKKQNLHSLSHAFVSSVSRRTYDEKGEKKEKKIKSTTFLLPVVLSIQCLQFHIILLENTGEGTSV